MNRRLIPLLIAILAVYTPYLAIRPDGRMVFAVAMQGVEGFVLGHGLTAAAIAAALLLGAVMTASLRRRR